ncbi:MAG: ATP-grasp domain-containing protein [Egibacteraceae bacterium]
MLFTSAGRRVELFRAFRRAYTDLGLDGRLIAIDVDPLAPTLEEADRCFIVPRLSDDAYIPTLAAICRRERVGLVLPLIDPDIPILAAHKAMLEAAGAIVAVVPKSSAAICADKWRTFALFGELSVPTPQTWLPHQLASASFGFPVLVKPRFGSAGQHVYAVHDDRELDFFLGYVPEPVVQELLPGPEITTDVLCNFEGEALSVVSRERIEVRSGEVAKGKTVYDPRIAEDCCRIAKALRAAGPITVQCMRRDDEHFFTEVNARLGGGLPLGIAAGARPAHWLLQLAIGQVPDAPPLGSYELGLHLSRFDDSRFLTEQDYDRLAGRRL